MRLKTNEQKHGSTEGYMEVWSAVVGPDFYWALEYSLLWDAVQDCRRKNKSGETDRHGTNIHGGKCNRKTTTTLTTATAATTPAAATTEATASKTTTPAATV